MLEKTGWPGLIVSVWYYTLHRKAGLVHRLSPRTHRMDKDETLKRSIDCIETVYRHLIPRELYDEAAEDVFWLEDEYQRHRKR